MGFIQDLLANRERLKQWSLPPVSTPSLQGCSPCGQHKSSGPFSEASAGLGLLQFCNLNSFRTKFIIGFSIFMGLSVPQYFNEYAVTSGRGPVHSSSAWLNKTMQVVFTSPATVAAIIAVFLDRTVAHKHASTRTDSGRHWWEKFRYFDKDPKTKEFYSLPGGLTKYFPSI